MSKELEIEFYTEVKGLEGIEECVPKPTKKYMPDWFKNMPGHAQANNIEESVYPATKTVKSCPSFPDYFSQGFVVPMWADATIKYNDVSKSWEWRCGAPNNSPYHIEVHGHPQFLDHTKASFLGDEMSFVFKFVSPWRIRTPKGYSVLQLPMYYHFENEFSVLPGVIDTDIWHEVNQQITYHGRNKEVFIPRGTPLAQYIPFKRDTFTAKVDNITEEMRDKVKEINAETQTKFSGVYREVQRRTRQQQEEENI
jgi:hypothetical protein